MVILRALWVQDVVLFTPQEWAAVHFLCIKGFETSVNELKKKVGGVAK